MYEEGLCPEVEQATFDWVQPKRGQSTFHGGPSKQKPALIFVLVD
jgi:hypothetical protein